MRTIENTDVSVIITDNQKLIVWVNKQFSKMTGYTLEEVRGKKPSLLQGRNTEKPVVSRIRASLEKKIQFHDRITNYRKNGEEYICSLTVHPVFDFEGKLLNFVAFEVDNNYVNPDEIPIMGLTSPKKKYLTDSAELTLYFKLLELFRQEKSFLEVDISLVKVAKILDTNTKYLSYVINNQTEKNFKYFVNKFRVQEFQRLLSLGEMENYTLFSIGQQCGFKNKSTFYNVVLNHTGKTPKSISDSYLVN